MKSSKKGSNKANSKRKRIIDKNFLNGSIDYKNKDIETLGDEDKTFLNSSL